MAERLKLGTINKLPNEVIDRTLTSVEVEPTQEEQVITAPEGYNGFNEVKVKGARLQQKIVTPSKEIQVIKADEGYYGLSDVIVSATPFNNDDVIEEIDSVKEMLTDGANATAEDIKLGKTAYVGGKLITGTFEIGGTIEITDTEIKDVTNYQYAQVVDNNLNAENIASGKNILGVEGTFSQDATATAEDILSGKTAYIGGAKVEGTYKATTLKALLDATKSSAYLFFNSTLTDVSDLISYNDTENVTNMNQMFSNSKITTQPSINMSNVKDMSYMYNNSSLITATLDNNPEVVNMIFQNCKSLKTVILSHTFQPKSPNAMFYGCTSLITVKSLNLINANYDNSIFYNCVNLTNLAILNLKFNLQVGSGKSYGHLLTLESLLGLCQECVNVNASRTLTIGTTNKNKLANVYVKLTGEPEEDETLPKLPMVQCESTDEGAMLISEYMTLKKWTLG